MEFENWTQVALIVVGLLVLWGVLSLVLRLARRVIGCGCGLIVILGVYLSRWIAPSFEVI
jgi:hypothetical protein